METEVRIRAFRATDDSESCLRFILGHQKVLENHGVHNVTSAVVDWMYNPSVFVIVVESLDGTKLYGGARVHAADGKNMLPIEIATGSMDARVHEYVAMYAQNGTGELCGLWNSIEVAGLGIGSYFPARVGIIITELLGFDTLFGLCSPLTLRFNEWIGCRPFTKIGMNGTFYYPKIDMIATAVFLADAHELSLSPPRERDKMFYLRKNPVCVLQEKSPFKNISVTVHYEIDIAGLKEREFKIANCPVLGSAKKEKRLSDE
ncbi:MAG: hypothetical protein JO072_05415 [Parafilimonas sp.]|nr:hypothetical protein [Parafilimonas sp.]